MRISASTETLLGEDGPVVEGKPGWAVEGWGEIPKRILKDILKLSPKRRGKAWLTGTFCLGEWGTKVWGQGSVA